MSALPEFRAALVQHPEALAELSDDSLLRYTRGQLPRVLRWMMRYPALLHALARDAEQLRAQPEHALDPHRPHICGQRWTPMDWRGPLRTPVLHAHHSTPPGQMQRTPVGDCVSARPAELRSNTLNH